jgi:hypothetical protein
LEAIKVCRACTYIIEGLWTTNDRTEAEAAADGVEGVLDFLSAVCNRQRRGVKNTI